jgi:hypothetical protein
LAIFAAIPPCLIFATFEAQTLSAAAYKRGIGSSKSAVKYLGLKLPTYPPHRGIGGFSFLAVE